MYHEYIFTWYIFSQIRVKLIKKYYSFFLQPTYLQANNLISFYRYLQSVISQVALSFLNIFEEFFSGCTLQQFKLSFCDVGFSRSSIPKYFVFIIMFLILSCCDRFTKICSIKVYLPPVTYILKNKFWFAVIISSQRTKLNRKPGLFEIEINVRYHPTLKAIT